MSLIRLGLTLAAILITGSAIAQSGGHDHHGNAEALDNLTLNDGEQWVSDEPLRQGMSGIRDAVAEAHTAIRAGEYEQADYLALAGAINGHIRFMFTNCNLDPEPDGQLHIILSKMMQATETLKTGDTPREAMPRIVQALNAYSDTFRHVGWQGIGQ